MRIRKSTKVINGVACVDVVSKGKVVKTFIGRAAAEAYIADIKIQKYTQTKSYKEEMVFVEYYGGTN
jgi:hypothetical protein